MLLNVWVLACSTRSDEDLYREALSVSPEAALPICSQVRDAAVRADCLLGVAEQAALADRPVLAWEACAAQEVGGFQDECAFLVVDRLPMDGIEGWRRCEAAGTYRENCVGHILTAHLEGLDGLHSEVGEEDVLRKDLARAGRKLGVEISGQHFQRSVKTALTRQVARRWRDRPFDESECGSLERELCRRSYAETMQAHMDQVDQAGVCEGDLSVEGVQAGGGTPWVEDSDAIVAEAWARLCQSWGFSAR